MVHVNVGHFGVETITLDDGVESNYLFRSLPKGDCPVRYRRTNV